MKKVLVSVSLFFLTGCVAVSSHQQFYKAYLDPKSLKEVEWLRPGEEPKVDISNNLTADLRNWRAKEYVALGYSSFNGPLENEEMVGAQARRVRATVAVMGWRYTNTETATVPLFLPDTQTTYYKGRVGGLKYKGSTETHGTTVVPVTTRNRRYDQGAIFFVKSTKKFTFGVLAQDLTAEMRQKLERNTGVFIYAVLENSAAFNSNVINGDIVIEVDGKPVKNKMHMQEISKSYDTSKGYSLWIIIRKGKEREIKIKFQ